MSENRGKSGIGTLAIGIILMIALAGGVLYFYRTPVVAEEDDASVTFDYDTVLDIPDETDVNDNPTTEDLEEEGKITITDLGDIDRDGDGITDSSDPDADGNDIPDEEEDPLPPPDYAFSGVVNAKAELLDSSGSPLSIISQAFVKTRGGVEIDSLRLTVDWDFILGEDLDEESVEVNVIGTLTTYYQNAVETYFKGEIYAGEIFNFYAYDAKGYATYTWKMDDPELRLDDVQYYGDLVYLSTTENSFVLNWEATVETKGGVEKVIKGEFGIWLFFMWDSYSDSLFDTPDQTYWDYYFPADPNANLQSIVQMTTP
jgi:hypothetical protein